MEQEKINKSERRVLIVDDDRDFAESIVDILAARDYRTAVINRKESIDQTFMDFDPHVAIIDIRLGGISGIDLIKRFRDLRPAIVCVMVTAYASVESARDAIQQGAYDYLRKPVNVHDLILTIERCFEKISLEQEKQTSQRAFFNRLLYEEGLAACSHALLTDTPDAITEAIQHLMTASNASRVYIYQNFRDPMDRFCMRLTHMVPSSAAGAGHSSRHPLELPYVDGFTRWEAELSMRKPITGPVRLFPKSEKEVLSPQEIRSLLVLPIHIGDEWYGFIGFDDREEEREWSRNDIRLLETAAEMIGAYIKRNRTEEAIRRSEEQYRLLAGNIKDVIWTTDLNFNITYITPSIEKISGYTIDKVIKMRPEGMLTPRSTRRAYRFLDVEIQNILEGRFKPAVYEMEIICRDDSIVYLESTISIMYNKENKPTHILGVTRDITERKKAEAEKEKMQTRLSQTHKMEAIGTLAGGIAHDFNNILSGIFGYAELALRKSPADGIVSVYLHEILQAAKRAKGLIDQILTLSRQQEHERKPIHIGAIIEEAVRLISVSLPANINFFTDIKADPDVVSANAVQIHQIITNLCTNAIHAMKENGGMLSVKLEKVSLDQTAAAKYPGLGEGSFLRLEVSDTGHGIPDDILNKIFDPFFTTKEKGEGSGLGLSVIDGIIKSHGGAVMVTSAVDKGTTFEVFLPIDSGSTVEIGAGEPAPLPGGSETILIVDDEAALVNMEREIFEDLGYSTAIFTSSVEALETFRSHPDQFDIVIADQTMPGMTGAAMAKLMFEIRPDLPFILCTGFSEDITHPKVKSMGIREIIFKPATTRELAETVRRVLDSPSVGRAAGEKQQEEAFFRGKRVLVVDDLASNRKLFKRMLETIGCWCDTVANGEDALKCLREGSFDMILMDISMPVMDGIEATRIIRTELNSSIPVIVITGKDIESDRESFLNAGINDFLMKPIRIDGVKNLLRKWTR